MSLFAFVNMSHILDKNLISSIRLLTNYLTIRNEIHPFRFLDITNEMKCQDQRQLNIHTPTIWWVS